MDGCTARPDPNLRGCAGYHRRPPRAFPAGRVLADPLNGDTNGVGALRPWARQGWNVRGECRTLTLLQTFRRTAGKERFLPGAARFCSGVQPRLFPMLRVSWVGLHPNLPTRPFKPSVCESPKRTTRQRRHGGSRGRGAERGSSTAGASRDVPSVFRMPRRLPAAGRMQAEVRSRG